MKKFYFSLLFIFVLALTGCSPVSKLKQAISKDYDKVDEAIVEKSEKKALNKSLSYEDEISELEPDESKEAVNNQEIKEEKYFTFDKYDFELPTKIISDIGFETQSDGSAVFDCKEFTLTFIKSKEEQENTTDRNDIKYSVDSYDYNSILILHSNNNFEAYISSENDETGVSITFELKTDTDEFDEIFKNIRQAILEPIAH